MFKQSGIVGIDLASGSEMTLGNRDSQPGHRTGRLETDVDTKDLLFARCVYFTPVTSTFWQKDPAPEEIFA
jgi:hypothetical protein